MPFFERIYRTVKEFCDSIDGDISINILCECLQQLVDNKLQPELLQIPVPEDFITDEKVGIWKTLKKKLKTCLGVDDSVYKSIDIIWNHWSRLLFEKELKERKDVQNSITLYPASPIFSLTPASTQSSLNSPCSFTYAHSSSNFSISDPSLNSTSSGFVFTSAPNSVSSSISSSNYSLRSPCSFTYVQSSSNLPCTDPSLSSTSSCLTPAPNSVSSSISSPYSSDSYNTSSNNSMGMHESVRILKNFSTKVMTEDGYPFGSFYFAKKVNEKYICQTDGCKMTAKKECKIRNEGVTRETLIGHATKYHSISLNLKKKIGILQKGFACALCSESFTRPQTLSNHTKKYHEAPESEETWLDQSWEPTQTGISTVPITSDSSGFTLDEIESLSCLGNDKVGQKNAGDAEEILKAERMAERAEECQETENRRKVEDQEEEEILQQAMALSLEQDGQELLTESRRKVDDQEEEEMLQQAMALSLSQEGQDSQEEILKLAKALSQE